MSDVINGKLKKDNAPINDDLYQFKKYIIGKVKLELSNSFPDKLFLKNPELFIERVSDQIVFRFRSYFAGREYIYEGVETTKVPLSWWEHTKKKFIPKSLLKYYPVKYRVIVTKNVRITNICPHIKMTADNVPHLEFMVQESK